MPIGPEPDYADKTCGAVFRAFMLEVVAVGSIVVVGACGYFACVAGGYAW